MFTTGFCFHYHQIGLLSYRDRADKRAFAEEPGAVEAGYLDRFQKSEPASTRRRSPRLLPIAVFTFLLSPADCSMCYCRRCRERRTGCPLPRESVVFKPLSHSGSLPFHR